MVTCAGSIAGFRAAARHLAFACVALASLGLTAPRVAAQIVLPDDLADELVCTGLSQPVGITILPDGRVLVAELKTGNVRLVVDGVLAPAPLLTVDSLRTDHGERGLLGLAVDARWPRRPYLYVHYNHKGGRIRVARYRAGGDLEFTGNGSLALDAWSRYDILTDPPDVNGSHNGGTLRFGPDGMLYVSLGDDYVECDAQNLDRLNGKILRLDVALLPDGPGGPPDKRDITPPFNPFPPGANRNAGLVWALGLRNPFRFHVDWKTGDLFAADVGLSAWEELDWMPESGMNFGWPLYEGPSPFMSCGGASTPGLAAPILSVDRTAYPSSAGCSVGLYRYIPGAIHSWGSDFDGDYFFSDISVGYIRRLKRNGTAWSPAAPVAGQPSPEDFARGYAFVTDFLQGPDGAVYYVRNLAGELRRIINVYPVSVPGEHAAGVSFGAPYPSPAAGTPVMLHYTLEHPARTELAVYDVSGRRLRTLVGGALKPAGRHQARWDGHDEGGSEVPAGVYFARLQAGGQTLEQRVTWLR